MIDIPASQIISTIQEQKGLSESEIKEKIDAKLKQLAGLISEDGAAHIIANELGVEFGSPSAMPDAKIKDLSSGMRSVSVPGKVSRKYEMREFNSNGRQGKVASFMLGDETGVVRVTLWNEQTDLFEKFKEGDTIKISNAFVKENRGYNELHLNNDSQLEVNPSGVSIQSRTQSADRKTVKELVGDEDNVEVLGTIVQVYDPRFFDVCPQCNRRVTDNGGAMSCATHGEVTPSTNYVVSAFLDDGTGNIRTTFWKQQTQRLLGKEDAEVLAYKENPLAFEGIKTELLGEIVKVVGRCKKNDAFDRIELTANLIFKDINPEEELARMSDESNNSSQLQSKNEGVESLAQPAKVESQEQPELVRAQDAQAPVAEAPNVEEKPESPATEEKSSIASDASKAVETSETPAVEGKPSIANDASTTEVPKSQDVASDASNAKETVQPVEAKEAVQEKTVQAEPKPTVIMDDELTSNTSEEAISLDDLEDLDEQI